MAKVKFKISSGEPPEAKELEVTVPDYLKTILIGQLKRRNLIPNNTPSQVCTVCAVNAVKLREETLKWVIEKICSKCDKIIPYVLQHPTSALEFNSCQTSWYLSNVMAIPTVPNIYMIEGSVSHAIDRHLSLFFSVKKNVDLIAQHYPSRLKMNNALLDLVQKKYDEIMSSEVPDGHEGHEAKLLQMRQDITESVLSDQVAVWVIRLFNDIKYGGDYHKLLAMKWMEERVYGHYEDNEVPVKIFLTGRVDKLYKLGNGSFFVRDDKGTRVIRKYAVSDGGFYDSELQLGSYDFMLSQMYDCKTSVIGGIWLSRFFDIIPCICDVAGFLNILKSLSKFIFSQTAPMRHYKGGKCNENCGYWSYCGYGEST